MQLRNILQLIIGVLFFSQPWLTKAQTEPLRFKHLSLAQGLSHSRVTCALQDQEGFMWFGTQYGLNKYDGYTFKVFRSDPNSPANSLQHNYIKDIHEDKSGRIWVITQGGGLHQIDKQTDKIIPHAIMPLRNNSWNVLFSFYEDQQGIFWLGSYSGILRFDPRTKQFTQYKFEAPVQEVVEDTPGWFWVKCKKRLYRFEARSGRFTSVSLSSALADTAVVSSIYPDKQGGLWLGTFGSGLFRINTKIKPLRAVVYNPEKKIKPYIRAKGIYQDRKGYIWLSTTNGLQRIDIKSDQVNTYQAHLNLPGSLSSNEVLFTYEDLSGTFWVGTDNGINQVASSPKRFRASQIVPSPSVRLIENHIRTILEDHTGTQWIGAWRKGLYYRQTASGDTKFTLADQSDVPRLMSRFIRYIYEDRTGRLWVVTNKGLHLLNRSTGKFSHYPAKILMQYIAEDHSGKLWLTSHATPESEPTIVLFDPETAEYRYYPLPRDANGKYSCQLICILVSRTGDIWVGSLGGGISRLQPGTGQFTNYLPDYSAGKGKLNDIDVRTLYEDEKGIVWAGTNQGGLNRFDPKTNSFTYYTTREGLPSNRVESITGDAHGNLWLGTNQGISRFNPQTQTFRNYDVADGLPDNQFVESCVYRRKDKLLFGSVNGFVVFNPDSIKDNKTVLPVYITGLKVLENSRPISAEPLKLPYKENFLSFDFVALNYNSSEKNQYAYQLEGLDQDWVYSGTRRYASYPGLAPGTYTFRVKAANNDGIWNEKGVALPIIIAPPFWQTWWFLLLSATAVVGLVWGFIKQRENIIRIREAQKTELEKLKTLNYQHMLEAEQVNSFFAASMAELKKPDNILWDVVRNCIAKLSFENCSIYLLDEHRHVLVQKASWGPESIQQAEIVNPVEIQVNQGIIGAVAASGKALIVADTTTDSRYNTGGTYQQSILIVPMIDNGKVVGVIDCRHSQKNFYTERHLQVLTSIASHCTDRMKKVTAQQEVRRKEIELITLNRDLAISRLKTLRTQMNPHFIFNSLNSIQYFIALNDKQTAMNYLSKFARLVRQILDNSINGQVRLSEELEMLENYVALEQLRLDHSFDFVVQVSEEVELEDPEIPSLLIQPYLENAILHGIRPLKDRHGRLSLIISKVNNGISCVIEDNGIGREKAGLLRSSHRSVATELSQRRLQELTANSLEQGPRVTILDLYSNAEEPAGTRVDIILPVFAPAAQVIPAFL